MPSLGTAALCVMPTDMATDTYGYAHKAEKKRLNPIVFEQGATCAELVCLMPSRDIPPGTRSDQWDLAHDRANGGYLGPAHPRCNRGEGGRHKHVRAKTRRRWAL